MQRQNPPMCLIGDDEATKLQLIVAYDAWFGSPLSLDIVDSDEKGALIQRLCTLDFKEPAIGLLDRIGQTSTQHEQGSAAGPGRLCSRALSTKQRSRRVVGDI